MVSGLPGQVSFGSKNKFSLLKCFSERHHSMQIKRLYGGGTFRYGVYFN